MSPREWRLRIEDMLEGIDRIQGYTQDLDAGSFARGSMAVDAVLHNRLVIGEAACRVPPEVTGRFPEIPWRAMRAMRNVVVHQYFGAGIGVIWRTVTVELPAIREPLRRVLEE